MTPEELVTEVRLTGLLKVFENRQHLWGAPGKKYMRSSEVRDVLSAAFVVPKGYSWGVTAWARPRVGDRYAVFEVRLYADDPLPPNITSMIPSRKLVGAAGIDSDGIPLRLDTPSTELPSEEYAAHVSQRYGWKAKP